MGQIDPEGGGGVGKAPMKKEATVVGCPFLHPTYWWALRLGRAVFGLPSIRYQFPGLHNHVISQSSQTVIFFFFQSLCFFYSLDKCFWKNVYFIVYNCHTWFSTVPGTMELNLLG